MPKCVDPRFALLHTAQNADGGWGYFPGKQSMLEPTVYALLALAAEQRRSAAFARGWRLLESWQLADGSWRAGSSVNQAHWATSLCISLRCAVGVFDERLARAVDWLVALTGSESQPLARLARWVRPSVVEFDPALTGWPWQPGTSAWVEPTVHAVMALRHVLKHSRDARTARAIAGRIVMGERMLLDRQCRDGGWNYGNRRVLGADLPSYPETTALALMALDGHGAVDWEWAVPHVEQLWHTTRSPLARAWLAACLLQHRGTRPHAPGDGLHGGDILVASVGSIPWNRLAA
ncbi:MAG: hypothetical protein JWO48_1222 [Bryobacterales bacterium]|nr:hypothetical protein [Bryobacterales bacterium]